MKTEYTKEELRKKTYKELSRISSDLLYDINPWDTDEERKEKYQLLNWIDNRMMGRNV